MTRAAAAALLIAGWTLVGAPMTVERLERSRVQRAQPPHPAVVRASLALLPEAAAEAAVVHKLVAALAEDDLLARAETAWNRVVAVQLTAAQRADGIALVDLDAPSRPPPAEAPSADPDIVALARALLDRYGYTVGEAPLVPSLDAWAGTDRRTRARALTALVEGPGIEPAQAGVLLTVTLAFLDAQVRRSANEETIERLFPIAMGEAPAP